MKIDGLRVVDAKRKLVLNIRPQDIKKGDKKKHGSCAAARCILRAFDVEAARVHLGRTYIKTGRKWVRFHTPNAMRSEIISFDRAGVFQPGKYILSPMQPSHRATGKRYGGKKKKGNQGGRGKKRAPYHVVTGVRTHALIGADKHTAY